MTSSDVQLTSLVTPIRVVLEATHHCTRMKLVVDKTHIEPIKLQTYPDGQVIVT